MSQADILLVDDHELFREGLCNLIDAQPDLNVVGEAGDGLEALTLARDRDPDLIVMDISMPVCDGLEATRLIRQHVPEARILILTVHEQDEKLFEAVKAGACGYLLKSVNSAGFLQGVRGALRGEAHLPPALAASMIEEFARLAKRPESPPEDELPDLTPREREVLEHVTTGATDKQIAARLSISVHTVKTHVSNILSKLHVINRRQAARLATRRGWID